MDTEDFVRYRLSLARIALDDADIAELVAAVPGVQGWEDTLLSIIGPHEMPDLQFDPSPRS